MASLLQGFEEVQLVKPVGKTVLTVTDSAIRFNKATAEAVSYTHLTLPTILLV